MTVKTYTIKEAEALLHVQGKAIRRYIASGELKASKIGKAWIMTEADILDFIELKKRR